MANKMKAAKKLKPDEFPDKVTTDWLKQRMTITQIEMERESRRHTAGVKEKNEWFEVEWRKFKDQIEEGDEIWEFSTPRRYWNVGFGYAGYAIIRRGIAAIIFQTKMN